MATRNIHRDRWDDLAFTKRASALASLSPLFELLTFNFELSTSPKSFHHVSYEKTGGTPKEFQNEIQFL